MEFTNTPHSPVALLSLQAFQVFQQANEIAKMQRLQKLHSPPQQLSPFVSQSREIKSTTNKRANPYMEQNISANIIKKIKPDVIPQYNNNNNNIINPMLLNQIQSSSAVAALNNFPRFQQNPIQTRNLNDAMLDVLCQQLEGECNVLVHKIQDLCQRKEKIYSQKIKAQYQLSEDDTSPETPDFSIKSEGSFKVEFDPRTIIKQEGYPHEFEGFFLKAEVKEEPHINSIKKPAPKTPKNKSKTSSRQSSPESKIVLPSNYLQLAGSPYQRSGDLTPQKLNANPLVYQRFF